MWFKKYLPKSEIGRQYIDFNTVNQFKEQKQKTIICSVTDDQ
jgi:hypothetical protein